MASTLQLLLCLGMMAMCFANPVNNNVRWCVKSEAELKKCKDVSKTCGCEESTLSCVLRANNDECIKAIYEDIADAVTLDSGEVYKGSKSPYNLKPVAAENYGTEKEPDTCYYAVALVKESSNFMFKDLNGMKTCHTAIGRAAGWTLPVGTLIALGIIPWDGPESEPAEKAYATFVSGGCVPGSREPTLCKQCGGKGDKKCKASEVEPYYGYAGARMCLKDDKGDVAFVKHLLPDEFHKGYKLLCKDNTRKSVDEYETCSWGIIPAHAVVTVDRDEKVKAVTQFLEEAQKKAECKLFSSPHGKDLMFKDTATSLIPLPKKMDSFLYLSPSFTKANQAIDIGLEKPSQEKITWCTQSKEEKDKCDKWTIVSKGSIECVEASDAEECIEKVLKGEADAVTLDGGYLYTAGACGLIPVMQEIYDAAMCKQKSGNIKGQYYAVAVVKKSNKDITWNKLDGYKSCHTGLGRTAGYNVPVGAILKKAGVCDLGIIFTEGCIPGSDIDSKFCKLCAGTDKTKCLPNTKEPYYGYEGAFRCLLEKGDVAFVKHTTPDEIIGSTKTPSWATAFKKEDFELLCLDGSRKPIDNYQTCHLALVSAHAVISTPERKEVVVKILKEQQEKCGRNAGQDQEFQMFVSNGKKDQLFKDSTQCLAEVQDKTMNDFLGKEYTDAISGLRKCGKSGLLAACTFHTCKLQ